MEVTHSIQVNYRSTNNAEVAKEWLESLPELFAADLECAIRYSEEEIVDAKKKMSDEHLPKKERISYQAIANATALGHPYHCIITHCSVAWTDRDAYVFIIDNQELVDVLMDFLLSTKRTQVWHNYCYDGRFIRYYGGGDVINVEDTQILAKTLVNHVETFKARTGLKDLAGQWYGDWAISADHFTIEQQYEEKVLRYAGTDACATYKLWGYLQRWIAEENNGQIDTTR